MQTAAHTDATTGDDGRGTFRKGHDFHPPMGLVPSEIIRWVRLYKNPKTVPLSDLNRLGTAAGLNLPEIGQPPIWNMAEQGISSRNCYLMPSYNGKSGQEVFWVKWDPDTGDLFEDEEQPGNSGHITQTTHTSVGIGDTVAIAVSITGWGGVMTGDLAIGPIVPRSSSYEVQNAQMVITRIPYSFTERKWRLNANQSLFSYVPYQGGPWYVITTGTPGTPYNVVHTLVYQFEVTEEHVYLNSDGPWLKYDWTTVDDIRDITHTTQDYDRTLYPPRKFWQWTAYDWLWDMPKDARPTDTSVKVFNTFEGGDRFQVKWGGLSQSAETNYPWTYLLNNSRTTRDTTVASGKRFYIFKERGSGSHRHVPLYDPARADKDDIVYPKIEAPGSRATVEIRDAPEPDDPQTGEFTVSLHFRDGVIFEGHDYSPEGVAAFQERLAEAFADSPWIVTALTFDEANRPTVAQQGTNPRDFSESTQYALTLSLPEGMKNDAVELIIPENIVFDAGENGNFASNRDAADNEIDAVMISVDTSLTQLPLAEGGEVEVVEPEAGAYRAGDVIEVLVPFAEDGLTYIGDDPPYLTIYLGAGTANPRHATWQKGRESSGSTVVPFAYEIAVTDPIVSSVRVDTDAGVLRPAGTVLMNGAEQVWVVGDDPKPMGSGEKAPAPPADAGLSILTATSAPLPEVEASVQVLPVVPLLPDESDPKAGLSSVPRTPLVFNELGNGSGDTNDWLELRNVTGDVVSLKEWELSVVQDGKKEDTSLVLFPDVSVPADGLLLITNSDPTADGNLLAGGDDIATATVENKGSSHLYLVQSGLSLPDDGQFLLILRNTKEKLGLNEAFVDVAGGGGSGTDAFIRETTGDYDTYVWPLQVLEAPESATEDALSAGKVWLRAKVDIVGYHRDAWGEAAFTGLGYDRQVSKSAETAGTPGYPNGAVKTEAPTPRGAVTISEVMLDSAGGTLPQWIELYNASKTDALNLNRWELEIQNVDSEELVGRPIVRLTLQEKIIQPNQTLLIVTGNARASSENVFPEDRVYNLLELHDKNLRIKKPSDTFLSAMGFYLRLTDRNENTVDEVGNTDGNRRTDDTPAWALPVPLSSVEGMRSSLIRRYDKGVARDGTSRQGWALAANFARFKADGLHYGHTDDIGTPGYRQGGALPVELSSFSVTRLESGSVIVTWTTESEVDNAGFNLRRSLTRDGGWLLLNPALIAGAGTTGERQTYTFIDTSAKPGVEHYYQLEEVSFGGKPETLVTRRLRGPVSAAHRALKTLGEVKQREE